MKLFEFDTRDKKPKLWSLLILTAVAAVFVAILIAINPAASAGPVCAVVAAYCLAAVFVLLYSFREQIRYNPYSYNTIFYFGFALFALSVAITHIVLAVRIFVHPGAYTAKEVICSLLGSAKNYMLLSLPFLLVFSAALCVSNVFLIRRERFRPVNLLGIALSFFILAGEAFIVVFEFAPFAKTGDSIVRDVVVNLFAAAFLYFECMLLGTMVADAIAAKHEPEPNKDFIIILGCGLRKDGTPTPILRGRIERALSFARKQKEKTGKDVIFVTSGGKGNDEKISESRSMKNYLLEQGVEEDRIIEEDRSVDTFQNMKFSKEKIGAAAPEAKIVFATSEYHVFRSGLFARRVKMRAVGIGAKTEWYFWPNAAVREFAGLLIHHRLKQAIIFGTMIAVYAGLTVLAHYL